MPAPTRASFKEIAFGSEDFHKECELRNAVLRVPLGLDLYAEDLTQESQQAHFGLFDSEQNLIACLIAVTLSNSTSKLRQMAVAPQHQGQGLGRDLLLRVQTRLAQQGVTLITLHARISARGFYEKLGYIQVGGEFAEVGIPHVCMEKCL